MSCSRGSIVTVARACVLLGGLVASPALGAALGAAEIVSIVDGDEDRTSTRKVYCLRSEGVEVSTVDTDTELNEGDILASRTDTVHVGLTCGRETYLALSGRFAAEITAPGEAACAIRLDEGRAEVASHEPVRVDGAGVVFGNKATQYAVDLRPWGGFPPRALAFDGAVTAVTPAERTAVTTGFSLDIDGVGVLGGRARIAEHDYVASAAALARLDVAEATTDPAAHIVDRALAVAELEGLHYAVLSKPHDPVVREELIATLIRYRLHDRARYHQQRLEELLRRQNNSRVVEDLIARGTRRRPPPVFLGPPPVRGGGGTQAEVAQILDGLEPPPRPPPNPSPPVTDPAPVDPAPVDPAPVDPKPAPVNPESVDPESVDPESVDPESVDPEFVNPEFVNPEFVNPESVDPEPVDPEPVDPPRPDPCDGGKTSPATAEPNGREPPR